MVKYDPFEALTKKEVKQLHISQSLASKEESDAKSISSSSYRSPFRRNNSTKQPTSKRFSSIFSESYAAPDLSKKSKTPKDFVPGTKLDSDAISRKSSIRKVIPIGIIKRLKKKDVENEKSETAKQSSDSIASVNSATAEKTEVLSNKEQNEIKDVSTENITETNSLKNSVNNPAVSANTATADSSVAAADIDHDADADADATVATSDDTEVVLLVNEETEKKSAIEAERKDSVATVTEKLGSRDSDASKSSAGSSKSLVSKEPDLESIQEFDSKPSTPQKKEIVSNGMKLQTQELKANAKNSLSKFNIEGSNNVVDIGGNKKVNKKDILEIAKSRIQPILSNLDQNAKKQQLTDAEYQEYLAKERDSKHKEKLSKLKNKNESKYNKKEAKFNSKIEDLKKKIEDLNSKIANAEEQHKKDLEKIKDDHEKALVKEEAKFDSDKSFLLKEQQALQEKKQEELEAMIGKQKKLELDIKLIESKKTEAANTMKLLQLDIEEVESKVTEKKKELDTKQLAYEAKKAKLEASKESAQTVKKSLTEQEEKSKLLDSAINDDTALKEIEQIKSKIAVYEKQLSVLKGEASERSEAFEHLKQNLAEQKSAEQELQEALDAKAKIAEQKKLSKQKSGKGSQIKTPEVAEDAELKTSKANEDVIESSAVLEEPVVVSPLDSKTPNIVQGTTTTSTVITEPTDSKSEDVSDAAVKDVAQESVTDNVTSETPETPETEVAAPETTQKTVDTAAKKEKSHKKSHKKEKSYGKNKKRQR